METNKTLTIDELREELPDCEYSYPLMSLTPVDLYVKAVDCLDPNRAKALIPYLHAACEKVARKWESDGELETAWDLALEAAEEMAAEEKAS